jgi:hypothetical protein
MCDDDCPVCSARHMSPEHSDNLTKVIERRANVFVVLRSSDLADDGPEYEPIASFAALGVAEAYLRERSPQSPDEIGPFVGTGNR